MSRILTIAFWVASLSSQAQDTQWWGDVTLSKNLSQKWSTSLEAGIRHQHSANAFTQMYIRPFVTINATKSISILGGFSYWYTDFKSTQSLNELRPWQGVRGEWKLWNHVSVVQFLRLEERKYSGSRSDTQVRWRHLSSAVVPFSKTGFQHFTWYGIASFEYFEDINDDMFIFINRDRVYAGLGYVTSSSSKLEFYYIPIFSRNTESRPLDLSVTAFRLRWQVRV